MDNIIQIKDLNFNYGEKKIFVHFDLMIPRGQFISIIGPNASGKSTLIKLILGLEKNNSYINVNGYLLNDFYLKEIRRLIGVVFEYPDIHFIGETVIDDLAFSLENLQYKHNEITREIQRIAKDFKLEKILKESPNNLNDSDKQKVAIASALISNPKILILDEALSQLNGKDRKLIFKILKKYQKDYNLTIILVTHNMEDVINTNYVIALNRGKIHFECKVKDLVDFEDKLNKIGIELPFSLKLSQRLYHDDSKKCIDIESLVDTIWP